MFHFKRLVAGLSLALGIGAVRLVALESAPGVVIENPNWSIIMTPQGYSDVAVDNRPGFEEREYLSGEWAAAIFYSGGSMPIGPVWLRKEWAFPCWESNSDFAVIQSDGQDFAFDSPLLNSDGFQRLISRIANEDVEITIFYEMVDTGGGTPQGFERAGAEGSGGSIASDRYVLMQRYRVKNISGGPLSGVRFYHFLHGLKSGISLYDDRLYTGALSPYRYDNTQRGTSLSLHTGTGEIFEHDDIVCMHAMVEPFAVECGYFGKDLGEAGVDDHRVGKPSVGTHLSVEADSLNGVDFFDPPEERWVSGAMGFTFPNLAEGAEHEITLLLSIQTNSVFFAPAPQIRIIDEWIEDGEYVIDFEETTGAPLTGFLLRTSKDMQGSFPDDWPQVPIGYTIDLPHPGANRFRIPIDPSTNPRCYFIVESLLD